MNGISEGADKWKHVGRLPLILHRQGTVCHACASPSENSSASVGTELINPAISSDIITALQFFNSFHV
jgi:hypothetical protein